MGGIDATSYNQADSSLDAYKGVEPPKIDYEAIARKKIEAEMKVKQKLVQKEQTEKDLEDMNIELFTFAKTLKPSAMHKAL